MEIFYFGQSSRRLFGVLDGPSQNPRGGLVFCPPFGDEAVATYAALARWSKELAARDFAVLRFHPYGTGESDGTFADFNLQGALRDVSAAVSCLATRTGLERVGLFGARFGGFLAAQAALEMPPEFLILWSPITNPRQYFRDLLRMRLTADLIHLGADRVGLTTQGMTEEFKAGRSVDVLGNEFSPEFYQQMTAGPLWPVQAPSPKVLWLSRLAEKGQCSPLAQKWADSGRAVDMQFLPEAPFWEELSRIFPEKFGGASDTWLAAQGIRN